MSKAFKYERGLFVPTWRTRLKEACREGCRVVTKVTGVLTFVGSIVLIGIMSIALGLTVGDRFNAFAGGAAFSLTVAAGSWLLGFFAKLFRG